MATKSAQAARRAIDGLDLKEAVTTTAKAHRWSRKRAAAAELWYRRHLWLAYLNRGKALGGLAADADQIWHAHILNTPKYERDCVRIFGQYVDHIPGRRAAASSRARVAYKREFGRVPPLFEEDCISIRRGRKR